MSRMFEKVAKLTDVGDNMNNWDVSNVTNMGRMFNAANVFNQNISNWKVGNVTNMVGMFSDNTPLRFSIQFSHKHTIS